jgi:2-dehydro-3-deoxygalactonokinase
MTPPDWIAPDWIAVDWGSSHLRAWAMAGESPVAQAASDAGMTRLDRDGFEPALLALVGDWLAPSGSTPVIASGMVGSRQGWVEAPYRPVPCPPLDATALTRAPSRDARLAVTVVGGLKQADPPDVIRGEEVQIAGFLAAEPGFDGVLCLPGTHSKWVRVSAGEVVGFLTCLTGELFDLLSRHSVLRHGLEGWDDAAFLPAVQEGLARPERLAAGLFTIRAGQLIAGLDGAAARARLSGLLIGAELAAARGWWLGMEVAVIGAGALARLYAGALGAQGVSARLTHAEALTLRGLCAAHRLTLPSQEAARCAR